MPLSIHLNLMSGFAAVNPPHTDTPSSFLSFILPFFSFLFFSFLFFSFLFFSFLFFSFLFFSFLSLSTMTLIQSPRPQHPTAVPAQPVRCLPASYRILAA